MIVVNHDGKKISTYAEVIIRGRFLLLSCRAKNALCSRHVGQASFSISRPHQTRFECSGLFDRTRSWMLEEGDETLAHSPWVLQARRKYYNLDRILAILSKKRRWRFDYTFFNNDVKGLYLFYFAGFISWQFHPNFVEPLGSN